MLPVASTLNLVDFIGSLPFLPSFPGYGLTPERPPEYDEPEACERHVPHNRPESVRV